MRIRNGVSRISQQLIVGMDLPANQAILETTALALRIAVLQAPNGTRSREQPVSY